MIFIINNHYVSRIVGKQGKMIKTIKTETCTGIDITKQGSWIDELERVITINGELENCINALSRINEIIRNAYESDTINYAKMQRRNMFESKVPMVETIGTIEKISEPPQKKPIQRNYYDCFRPVYVPDAIPVSSVPVLREELSVPYVSLDEIPLPDTTINDIPLPDTTINDIPLPFTPVSTLITKAAVPYQLS